MKILFDHQTFSFQNYGGISLYFVELMKELKKYNIDFDCPIRFSSNINLKNANLFSFKENFSPENFWGLSGIPKQRMLYNLLEKSRLLKNPVRINNQYSINHIRKNNFDIFHPTYFDLYYFVEKDILKKPFVITIYDLIHEKFPGFFDLSNLELKNREKLLNSSSAIFAISESTKNDIIEIYNIPKDKIFVTHLATSINQVKLENKYVPKFLNEYILFVGNRDYYKNFYQLLFSFKKIFKFFPNLRLVALGGNNFSIKEIELMEKLRIRQKVIHVPIISESQKKEFYSKSKGFIFPSLYEGFGIPLLEAMECGTPILCSNTSSFPEVAGDSAIYFDPNSIDSISNSILKLLQDQGLRQILLNNALTQKLKFSWEKTIKKTLSVYKELI